MELVTLDRDCQYGNDHNLRARQRLWQHQEPAFDAIGWVLDLADLAQGSMVLDVGCGNGLYLAALADRRVSAVGCDLSLGMLEVSTHPSLACADAVALPFPSGRFDAVLAPHMLYHVPDRQAAARELRRVMARGGVCVVVTNGVGHIASVRALVEQIVGRSSPGWRMVDWAAEAFSLENGAAPLQVAFSEVRCQRPVGVGKVMITDAAVVADYVASVADPYQAGVGRPWHQIVDGVRQEVQQIINRDGAFVSSGDVGAFICR